MLRSRPRVEEVLDDHPLSPVLTSLPGVGVRTAARTWSRWRRQLLPAGRASGRLRWPGPVTRRSGSSVKGEHPARGGNKRLKNAVFLFVFAALHDPESRAFYHRKRAQGKKHNAALVCLARRRIDVIYAKLRRGTYDQANNSQAA